MVRLEGFERRKPVQLSGGQRQRVALARALVNEPSVLLLDEPLGALDFKLRQEMQLFLKRIQQEVGITFVYVTHDQEEALTMSDRIAILDMGRIEQVGTAIEVYEHPVGTLVARNVPKGEPAFGVGSHCDSNRNGGKYDGTMGVVTALEVCRLNRELGLDLPLQLISFLEEEGSGFGQMLLGSRIIAQRVTEEDLRERFRAIDDGRSFWEHAADAGYAPDRWRECAHVLDDLTGWIEMHIEQARVLQDTGNRIGLVTAIAGYVHADVVVHGRGDHAGATPMDFRLDPGLVLADSILELERLARAAGRGTVGTVGEIEVEPSLINVVPGKVVFIADLRHPDLAGRRALEERVRSLCGTIASERGLGLDIRMLQERPPVPMHSDVRALLARAATDCGVQAAELVSGAGHDAQILAARMKVGMLFVPSIGGRSHCPDEATNPRDLELGTRVLAKALELMAY